VAAGAAVGYHAARDSGTRLEMEVKPYRLVDLFCGCGGISRGFERTGRFATEFGIEISEHPVSAFRANIRNSDGQPTRVHQGDIGALAEDASRLWDELRQVGIERPMQLDVLAGGPPCQGFSRNGVRLYEDDDRTKRFYDLPKNHLYKSFLRIAEETRPSIILVENVREFLNFNRGRFYLDLTKKFSEMGYDVRHAKLNAATFGVPQVRHRVFFVAVRKDVADSTGLGPTFPAPTHEEPDEGGLLALKPRYRTVRDAISDLPEPPVGRTHESIRYTTDASTEFGRLMRSGSGAMFNHFARPLSPKQVARINAVGVGRMKHVAADLQTESFYGSAYRRLAWDEPALTITTWVYHVGSGRFAHPEADRGVTMREAARLQSFDDDFWFPPLVNPVSQMIGNAVPPLVAQAFAREFARILDAFRDRGLKNTRRGAKGNQAA
jgi:DNA (cytosine-5)-methyltransferase 1